jgi:hypothetical protein
MNPKARGLAVTESYPTFWDQTPTPPAAPPVAPDEAYSTFINLAEDDFPSSVTPQPEPRPGVAN